ncbi:MAG TPA: transposase [Terriglobia bacterium]|nr:transposase [Terriglobia bacterium]
MAPDRQKHGEAVPVTTGPLDLSPTASPAQVLRDKLWTPQGREVYNMRKAVVEPVFAQIKEQRGFRRFLLRGLKRVIGEWRLICAAHNLLKLYRCGWKPQRA